MIISLLRCILFLAETENVSAEVRSIANRQQLRKSLLRAPINSLLRRLLLYLHDSCFIVRFVSRFYFYNLRCSVGKATLKINLGIQ